ncbi:CsxC family protein [Brevibacillus reuszeri]|uniref:CsxC family protein n=1 Tax=Brevibacillus reuszeri TaxID=54915 RepID=UPI00289E6A59|nr:hypothetical protein [Brevibacillus reuszeri]
MGKHDDNGKFRVEYYCDGKDDDDQHHHKHDKDDHKKPPSNSCSVGDVHVFGTSSIETNFPKTIKVPVTLAETSVVVCVEANMNLEKPATEIIRAWKSAIIEQCELVPTFNPYSAKLFVKGFIRKNIEYATVDHTSPSSVCGDIRHMTAFLPFDFCTDITFPQTGPSLQLSPDFSSSGALANHCGNGAQINTGLYSNRQVYNEKPFCELGYTEFTELDIGKNLKNISGFVQSFTSVQEKIVLRIGLKILQNQQVPLPVICPTPPPPPPPKCNKKW